VEELIGPYSINTMPHQTAMAFYDHGVAETSIEDGIDQVPEVIKKLKSYGVDVDAVCDDLQKEGVRAFSESFKSLINSIDKKTK
jgi:transaldolase/transaldolase/glucose-6-phosphate isomerase